MKPTETTAHTVRALKATRAINLDKLFASGIDVTVTDYTTGVDTVERVTIHAEFAAPFKEALIYALEQTLTRRVEGLTRDLCAARAALECNSKRT